MKSGTGKKKFYRDTKDKILAGVLSGASKFFGGDVLIWRIGFVFLCLMWSSWGNWFPLKMINFVPIIGLPIFIYLLLAFLAPAANTPEEKLKMKGLDVNPQNLADELSQDVKEREAMKSGVRPQSSSRGCISGFFSVLGVLAKIFIGLVCLGFVISFIATFAGMVALLISPDGYLASKIMSPEALALYHDHTGMFWACGISLLLVFFIPGYCALHSLLSSSGKATPMSMAQRLLWIVLWLASIGMLTAGGVYLAKTAHDYYVKEHTHDGVFFENDHDWNFFRRNNYRFVGELPSDEDTIWDSFELGRLTEADTYYDGTQKTYLYGYDYDGLNYWQVEREESGLEPGTYNLVAIGRVDNRGGYVYAISDSVKQVKEIPVYKRNDSEEDFEEAEDSEDSEISENSEDSEISESSKKGKVKDDKKEVVVSTDSLGDGWARVVIEGIEVKDGKVRYGVSTMPRFTGNESRCNEINVGEFQLVKE